ncbi:MAG: hypothetical protein KGR48_03010 [Alphaproteobacteria bacterium]|nr:hypothetical protein [Alphaproteobacteria bacterium]MDE2012005.1 winged helix-turn-helix domain-containing protein [Alphaproteobacteria bacterium]MDE2075420.1 winged helix-turn-helix domain-containing protein [Alphaproteobacteria bacterium]
MMPVIRISDQTWARLQQYAQPLVDTPDSVINAALDALDHSSGEKTGALSQFVAEQRRKGGEHTPQKEFRRPLIRTLYELGSSAPVAKIRAEMEKKLSNQLRPGDFEQVSSGDPRWWNAICWERASLVREGLFRNDSPRGTWELSDSGKAEATKKRIKLI